MRGTLQVEGRALSSRWRTAVSSLAAVLALNLSARAAGPSGSHTGLTEDDKPVSIFAGVAFGSDSNVLRASTGAESDTVTQILAGVAFTAGRQRGKVDFRAQYRYDAHAKLSHLNFGETRLTLAALTGTDKFRFRFSGAHETLVDPTDFVTVELLERTRTTYAPSLDLGFGAVGLGVTYSGKILDYKEATYDRLDLDEEVWSTELRWKLRQTRRLFAHFELGDINYPDTPLRNFELQRYYLGFRMESRRKAGIEVGLGADAVDKPGVTAELFALLRGTVVLRGGRSTLDAALTRGTEAAADADFKIATRFMVRYMHEVNRRSDWMVALSTENNDIMNPTTTSSPLMHVSADAGLNIELGSDGGKLHGRFYVTLRHEARTAPAPEDEYTRFRVLAGLALVH